MNLLEIRGLTRRFGGVLALDGIDLDVREGEVHSIIGENGAGKSTLLKVISGIVRAEAGEVRFRGERITNASPNRLFSLGISAAFQETSLFDNLTVSENLFLGGLYRPGEPRHRLEDRSGRGPPRLRGLRAFRHRPLRESGGAVGRDAAGPRDPQGDQAERRAHQP